jgi:hypothetical protein
VGGGLVVGKAKNILSRSAGKMFLSTQEFFTYGKRLTKWSEVVTGFILYG